jgi:hypothetical protein
LEEEVRKCRKIEKYLREHRRHYSGSYDFSAFNHLVVVLCTTAPVYVANLDAPIFVNKARKIVSLLAQSPMRS